MSNRFLGLLILVGFVGIGIAVYLYFFVYHVVVVKIYTNVSDYSVRIESSNGAHSLNYTCEESFCLVPDVPPFQSLIAIEKPGYDTVILERYLDRSIELKVELYPEVTFEPIPDSGTSFSQQTILGGSNGFSENSFVFQGNSIAHTLNNDIFDIDVQIPITYIKTGESPREFLLVTRKGTFLFDTDSQSSQYFTLFRDFVYMDGNIVGLVGANDTIVRNNFGLSGVDIYLVHYDNSTKTSRVIHSLGFDIQQIYVEGGVIVLFDEVGKRYSVSL
ncbi:hypothetical protein MK079_01960 [Candidatus Gracilibacteria bacterium]|nr:hypothetical protein [Candidatus Gracilibacteria bacterium]